MKYHIAGPASGPVTIGRTGYQSVHSKAVPVEAVPGKMRTMPDGSLRASRTDVTDAYRLYLRPLLGNSMRIGCGRTRWRRC